MSLIVQFKDANGEICEARVKEMSTINPPHVMLYLDPKRNNTNPRRDVITTELSVYKKSNFIRYLQDAQEHHSTLGWVAEFSPSAF